MAVFDRDSGVDLVDAVTASTDHFGQPLTIGPYQAVVGSEPIQGADLQGVPWPDNGTWQPVLDVTIPAPGGPRRQPGARISRPIAITIGIAGLGYLTAAGTPTSPAPGPGATTPPSTPSSTALTAATYHNPAKNSGSGAGEPKAAATVGQAPWLARPSAGGQRPARGVPPLPHRMVMSGATSRSSDSVTGERQGGRRVRLKPMGHDWWQKSTTARWVRGAEPRS